MNELMTLISTLPKARAILVSLVLALIYYLVAYDSGERLESSYAATAQQLDQLKAEVQGLNRQLEEVKVLRAAQERDAEKLNLLLGYIPEKLSKIDLLRAISNEVKSVGANLLRLQDRSSASQVTAGQEKNPQLYEELGVDVDLSGTYGQFMLFLANMTKLSNIVTIKEIKINAGGQKGATGVDGPVLLNCNAVLVGYRYMSGLSPQAGGSK